MKPKLFKGQSNDHLFAVWVQTCLYGKRDNFNFPIIIVPHLDSNIPTAPVYGVKFSQLTLNLALYLHMYYYMSVHCWPLSPYCDFRWRCVIILCIIIICMLIFLHLFKNTNWFITRCNMSSTTNLNYQMPNKTE